MSPGPRAALGRTGGPVARRVMASVVGLAAALAVIPVKAALNASVGGDIGFMPAVTAVVIAAWLGGFVPGIVATVTGILVETTFFMEPAGSTAPVFTYDRIRLVLFALLGILASLLAWLRVRAEERAHLALADAERAREVSEVGARRLEALQALTIDLAGAVTTDEIAAVVLSRGIKALLAERGASFLIEPAGEGQDGTETLRAVAWSGYREAWTRRFERLSIDLPLPVAEVARTGAPVFIEDPATYEDRYGPPIAQLGEAPIAQAVAAVPLEIEGRRFGVVAFSWGQHHDLPPDRQAFIAAIARLGAAAMDRGRLFDAERSALHRAEAAQRRLDLLAETGRILAMSLDYDVTLRRLAGLALPLMGDVCVVDAREPGGMRRLVATVDPALAPYAAVIEAIPGDGDGTDLVSRVLDDGGAGVFAMDDATIAAMALRPEHAAAISSLGARWALVMPMRVWDRTVGAMAFFRREDRRYDPEEIAIAEELGDRAGRALENARLHGEVARLADHERRHAAELEAVLAALGEGILVAGPGGAIRSHNEAAIRLLGGPAATVGDLLDRLVDADGRRPATLSSDPTEYRVADRPTAWVEVTAYPVAESTEIGSPSQVIVTRDVTAFRQGQALREAFLGLLSHELRTPVTTIYGGSAVLSKPGAALSPDTAADILADIAGEADRLYRLVEDLLVLARFDEGIELGDEPALLQHLVPAVVEQERGRWPAVAFTLDVSSDLPAVSGDETSIAQVVRNLLSNAAKYSDGGSDVCTVVERVEGGVVVRVRDNGPGIDPAEAEAIFSPFFRSPSTARMAGGAGIGLYVSRRLVDAMNGRIWASPRSGGGSEFSFILPLYDADGEA